MEGVENAGKLRRRFPHLPQRLLPKNRRGERTGDSPPLLQNLTDTTFSRPVRSNSRASSGAPMMMMRFMPALDTLEGRNRTASTYRGLQAAEKELHQTATCRLQLNTSLIERRIETRPSSCSGTAPEVRTTATFRRDRCDPALWRKEV